MGGVLLHVKDNYSITVTAKRPGSRFAPIGKAAKHIKISFHRAFN